MASWSELPQDQLKLIAHFLVGYTDQVRFACVCTSWRSILPDIPGKGVQPWLLLPRDGTNEKYEKFLISIHERRVHYLDLPEEVCGKKFRGSSHGWLVSIEDSPVISLYNPITRVQITLPPRYKFPDVKKYCAKKLDTEYALECCDGRPGTYFHEAHYVHENLLHKVVLSSSPTSSKGNVMVAAMYGSRSKLAYCKLGDKKWTSISKGGTGYDDAIFYEEKLYAVTYGNELEVFELSATCPKKVKTIGRPKAEGFWGKRYLVNTSIGLLQVHRPLRDMGTDDNYRYQTSHFKLYMYESSSQSWCKVEDIGENVLFLGLNASISISYSYLPPGGYYKKNHIYFTDDNLEQHKIDVQGGYDIGFYDLNSRHIGFWRYNDNAKYWRWLWPTPIWYIHNPEDFIKDDDGTTELGY